MVFGLINIPVGSIAKVNAEGNSGDAFELVSEYDSYSFDYSEQFYDDGPNALILVKVYPQLTDDYDVYTDGITGGMMWSVNSIYDDDAGFTGVILRGETQFSDRTKDNYLNIDIVKSGTTPENGSFGHISVPVELTDSSIEEQSDNCIITFDGDGGVYYENGEPNSSITVNYEKNKRIGDSTHRLPIPNEKEGYFFLGYKIDGDDHLYIKDIQHEENQVAINDYIVEKNVTFKAVWIEKCTVTFDANGGEFGYYDNDINEWSGKPTMSYVLKKDRKIGNNNASVPVPNERSGYIFKGYEIEGDENIYTTYGWDPDYYIDNYIVTKDLTFKAVWAEACTVTFDGNGGYVGQRYIEETNEYVNDIPIKSIVVEKGKSIGNKYILDPYTRIGYVFKGYKVDGDDSFYMDRRDYYGENEKNIRDYVVTEDVTFIAEWAESSIVTLDANGGVFQQTYEADTNENLYNSPVAHKKLENGEVLGGVYIPMEREGYVFKGYRTDEDDALYVIKYYEPLEDGEKDLRDYVVNGDVTFTAEWAETCSVTFDGDGGYVGESYDSEKGTFVYDQTIKTVEIEKGKSLLGNACCYGEKDGYIFKGIRIDGEDTIYVGRNYNLSENEKYIGDYIVENDVTFKVVWEKEEKEITTVTFDYNGGITSNPGGTSYNCVVTQKPGEKLNHIPAPEKENNFFVGWKKEGDNRVYTVAELSEYVVGTEDITFIAQYVDAVTITFDFEGGFNHVLWSTGLHKEYKTTFKVKKGEEIYISENDLDPISDEGRRVFSGWILEGDQTLYTIDMINEMTFDEDTTFKASWTTDGVMVKFYSPEGYLNSEDPEATSQIMYVKKGTLLDYCPIFTGKPSYYRPYYYVDYWLIDGDAIHYSSLDICNVIVENDLIICPVWKTDDISNDKYTITFDGNGGYMSEKWGDERYVPDERVINKYIEKGDKIGLDITPIERFGYIFTGYKLENSDTLYVIGDDNYQLKDNEKLLSEYVPNGNVTFYAEWKDDESADSVDITMDPGEGYILDEMSGQTGTGIHDLSDFKQSYHFGKYKTGDTFSFSLEARREGMVFDGWKSSLDESVASGFYIPNVSEDITFTAQYSEGVVVVLDMNGGYYGSKEWYKSSYHKKSNPWLVASDDGKIDIDDLMFIPNEEGKALCGWKKEGDDTLYSTQNLKNMTFTDDVTFVAQWGDGYKVSFCFDCDSPYWDAYQTYSVKDQIYDGIIPNAPYGYYIEYWNLDGDDKQYQTEDIMNMVVDRDLSFTAHCKECEEINITINGNGGTVFHGPMEVEEYNYNIFTQPGKKLTINNLTVKKEGYKLVGWLVEDDSLLSGTIIENIKDYSLIGDVTFTAQWCEAVDVTFDANGGSFYEKDSDVTTINKTLCKGDTIGEIEAEPISNDDSYEFAGWYIEGDEDTIYSTESLSEDYVVNEDVTFKAAWKEKGEDDEDCVITFDLNGGYLWFPGGNTTYENQIVVAKKNQYNNIFVNTPAPVVEGTGGPGPDIEFRAWKNTSTGEMVSPLDLHNYYVEDDTTFIAVFEPMVDVWIDFDSGYIAGGMDGSKSESARAKVFSGESLSRVFWYINGSTEFSGKWKVSINGQLVPIENDYDAKLLGWEVDGEYYPNDKLDECIITEEVSVKAVWDKEIYNCSKKGHNWDEGIVTKQPTCTEKGVKEFTCTICGKKRTVDIAAKGHTVVKDDAVAATTETTGLTEGSHCSVCKAIIKRQEIVPKKEDPNKKAEEEAKKKAVEEAKRKAEEEAKKKAEEEAKKKAEENAKTSYSNEWVDGKWYDQNGKQNYSGTLLWKSDAIGWWVEDTDGWYPKNSWQKIDGTWYYFKPDGYMAMDEYYNGYWFNKDGSWDPTYKLSWKSDATGWWVEDISGWWPSNAWLKIDGCWYYFDGSGYMVTNQYVSGWWIGADGVCR